MVCWQLSGCVSGVSAIAKVCSQFWSKQQANWQAPRYCYVLHLKEQVVTTCSKVTTHLCIRKHNTKAEAKKKETKTKPTALCKSPVNPSRQPIRQISTSAARVAVICDVGDFNSVFSFVFQSNPRKTTRSVCVRVFNPREFGCYGAISKVKSQPVSICYL